MIPRDLLDCAIKKFSETRRLTARYDKREKKEVFSVVKWEYYQQSRPKKSPPIPPSKKEEDIKKERKKEESEADFLQKGEKSDADFFPLPPIPKDFSFSLKDKLREDKAKILELERLLSDEKKRQYRGYTFEELKKEIEYRQGLQIQLAQNIIESELSTRTTENKVKELKEELKVRDENIAKVIEEGKEGDKVLKENFSGMIIPVVKGLGLS